MNSYASEAELSSVSTCYGQCDHALYPAPRSFNTMPLLVDVDDAARLLSLSNRTIWRLAENGRLPAVHVGRATRWVTADVVSFVDSLRERDLGCSANSSALPESAPHDASPTPTPSY